MEERRQSAQAIDFCSLGMFIIDEIHFPHPKSPVYDILGGAGSYAAVGARLFSPPPSSKTVGWIVDCGSDFPQSIRNTIAQWDTSCLMRETPERLTTRGWNEYGANEFRAFRYLAPKLRLTPSSCSSELIRAKCFHLICSPVRCIDQIHGVLERRHAECPDLAQPLFVWEPVPDLCSPVELENCRKALKLVNVVSPNHVELASFFGGSGQVGDSTDRKAIESYAEEWLTSGIGANSAGGIVVRCGKEGCYVVNKSVSRWMPAFYMDQNNEVVDPTGGGNTFIGAMGVALARGNNNIEEAAIWGSVAASFAIEQIGTPVLEMKSEGETWNGARVAARLDEYVQRLNTSR